MPPVAPSKLFAFAALAIAAAKGQAITGTFPATPLASKTTFTYPTGVPYKVDTDVGLVRGTQVGYNICNSTTENQESLCQTSFINSIDDFCLWAPHVPDSVVGNVEGEMVAWCTRPGRGTRLIPDGALQGVQFVRAPNYVQVTGFVNQELINIAAGDWGGEMDPHGADLRGNPMGGIIFTESFNGQWTQVLEWHNFIGGNAFCLKACDPSLPDDDRYCEHIFDRIGCAYNAPSDARNGTFESCDSDNQDFPGIYTENGQVMTYRQPPEDLGPISTMPYQPRVPASSNCVTHTSSAIYTGLPRVATTSSASTPDATGTGATTRRTGTSTATGTAAGAGNTDAGTNGAVQQYVSMISVVIGVVSVIMFV